jgi:hypothetical protein
MRIKRMIICLILLIVKGLTKWKYVCVSTRTCALLCLKIFKTNAQFIIDQQTNRIHHTCTLY